VGWKPRVIARLRLRAQQAVLGVPASEVAGRTVALEDVWGDAATQRLLDRLAHARDAKVAASIVERALAERLVHARRAHSQLAHDAAERLSHANVKAVAVELGVSERHLRRVFRDAIGVSPKAFAKLARFRRALEAAHADTSWAGIAATAGYYDQSHLIAEFRAISGVTPSALLRELRSALH
jgi:AraC-like DNA-binding protein